MASSTRNNRGDSFFNNLQDFPPVIDGRINFVIFLQAASDLVALVERLGNVFAPVKYDMQGNIDKVKKYLIFDETSCLLELLLHEINKGKLGAAESILWLNRAFLFFELLFQEIIKCLLTNTYDVNLSKMFSLAYKGSVKKYHNWVTQQIFVLICKMSPTLLQVMKSFEVENDVKTFESRLVSFNVTLHLVRCKIDDFFKDNNLFEE